MVRLERLQWPCDSGLGGQVGIGLGGHTIDCSLAGDIETASVVGYALLFFFVLFFMCV